MEWWQILIVIFFATMCAWALIDHAKGTNKRPTDLSLDVILIDLMKALQPNNRFYPDTADESMELSNAKKRIIELIKHRLGAM